MMAVLILKSRNLDTEHRGKGTWKQNKTGRDAQVKS